MRAYYLHITYKSIDNPRDTTHICTEIGAETARRLVRVAGKTLSHVGGNGVEVDRREERSMAIIARISTAPGRAYMAAMASVPHYAAHDATLAPAERAAAAAWRERIEAITRR